MRNFKVGEKVYEQGSFDICECIILEHIPNHKELVSAKCFDDEIGSCTTVTIDAYKVQYPGGDIAIVPAGFLRKTKRGMYQL